MAQKKGVTDVGLINIMANAKSGEDMTDKIKDHLAGGKTGKTYWNGEPTPCRRVFVIVGLAPVDTWWFKGLEGTTRKAVEVRYGNEEPFYLDDEDGSGWIKVTEGQGGPEWGHRSLVIERVVEAGGK